MGTPDAGPAPLRLTRPGPAYSGRQIPSGPRFRQAPLAVGVGDGSGDPVPDGSGAGDEGRGDGRTFADGEGDGEEDRAGELDACGERDGRPGRALLAPWSRRALRPAPGEWAAGRDAAGAGATTPKLAPGPGLGAPPDGGRIAIVVVAVRTAASPAVTAMIVGGSTRYGCIRTDRAQLRPSVRTRSSTIAAATPAAGRRGP